MSRRTKLIILGIFLVLLGMPTGYLVINWSPPEPLRFRLIGEASLPEEPNFPKLHSFEIEVRNTLGVPICVEAYDAELHVPRDQDLSQSSPSEDFATLLMPVIRGPGVDKIPPIPALGTCRYYATLAESEVGHLKIDQARVRYRYRSLPKHKLFRLHQWIALRLPYTRRESIPEPPSDLDTQPVEPREGTDRVHAAGGNP